MPEYSHRFTYTNKSGAVKQIDFVVHGECTVDEMLEAFSNYLRAVGFHMHPSATLEIMEPAVGSNNNDQD